MNMMRDRIRSYHNKIVKMLLREEEMLLFAPVDYQLQAPLMDGNNKVVTQKRREVTEDGKKWIEFDLTFAIGTARTGHVARRSTDPSPRVRGVLGSQKFRHQAKYVYDYPTDGPADIYAVGARPR